MNELIPKSIFDEDFNAANIGWCSEKDISRLFELYEGTVFVSNKGSLRYIPLARRTKLELITCIDPKAEFIKVLENYEPNHKSQISQFSRIGKNTIIHEGTIIEDNVIIGDNCTIGGVGFGYHKSEQIPHRGIVRIKKGTIIHSNVCIDRAVIGETVIGENVRIDNLVHIAHGVKIGDRSMIIANATICGSVIIGKDCWISPNSSIIQKVNIGDNAVIGLGSVVISDVPSGKTYIGNPAKELIKCK